MCKLYSFLKIFESGYTPISHQDYHSPQKFARSITVNPFFANILKTH